MSLAFNNPVSAATSSILISVNTLVWNLKYTLSWPLHFMKADHSIIYMARPWNMNINEMSNHLVTETASKYSAILPVNIGKHIVGFIQ